jgi:hypothetical protein
MNKLFAVYSGTLLLSRKEKGTGKRIPAVFFNADEANQIKLDFDSLIKGNCATICEIYPAFSPVKEKVI